jgi:fructoselysine 6-kinase
VIAGVGDNVVDRYLDLGLMYPGGNALNVSVFCRRLGVGSAYVGALGTDAGGDCVRSALAAEDVETERTRTVDGPNAFATVRLEAGERIFDGGDVGVSLLDLDPEDLDYLGRCSIVHTTETSRLETQLPELATALRDHGGRLSFDFGERRDSTYVCAVAALVHLAFFSGAGLTGAEARGLALLALEAGSEVAVVTRGRLGALYATQQCSVFQPAIPVPVVDTLGAGDAFIAGVLAGLSLGERPVAFLRSAAELAAQVCTWHGAFGRPRPDPATPVATPGARRGAAAAAAPGRDGGTTRVATSSRQRPLTTTEPHQGGLS